MATMVIVHEISSDDGHLTLETLFDYLAYGDTTSVRLVVLHLDIMNLAFS